MKFCFVLNFFIVGRKKDFVGFVLFLVIMGGLVIIVVVVVIVMKGMND